MLSSLYIGIYVTNETTTTSSSFNWFEENLYPQVELPSMALARQFWRPDVSSESPSPSKPVLDRLSRKPRARYRSSKDRLRTRVAPASEPFRHEGRFRDRGSGLLFCANHHRRHP